MNEARHNLSGLCAIAAAGFAMLDAGAVPPPPGQIVANCDAPTYASDVLVCSDASLRALDDRMRELLGQLDLAETSAQNPDLEPQSDWFSRRSLCAFADDHRTCLRALYEERNDLLEALISATAPPRQR